MLWSLACCCEPAASRSVDSARFGCSYTARYDASTAVLVEILRYFWDAATHLFEGLQLYLTL
jgi:hypothetical protein